MFGMFEKWLKPKLGLDLWSKHFSKHDAMMFGRVRNLTDAYVSAVAYTSMHVPADRF
jgi:hypothetical protein